MPSVPIGERHTHWSAYTRYAVAAGLLIAALSLRYLMQPLIDATSGSLAFLTVYPAALLAFYLCGTGPGILTALISGLASEYLFRPPVMGFGTSFAGYLPLGSFYLNTTLIGLAVALIRNQAARIRQSHTERNETERELNRSLEAMTRLHRLGQIPISEGNLDSLFNGVVETAIAITDADFGNFQLLEPESGDLRIVSQIGFPTWWIEFWDTVSQGQGVCGTALERGERVIVEDVEKSPIFLESPALDIQLRAGVQAVQSTPLFSRQGRPLGLFSTHYRMPGRPDERQLKLLDLLARQAADNIERAYADEALRQSQEDLNRAQQVGQLGSWRLDLRRNLLTWSDENHRIFGVPLGTLMNYESFLAIVHPDDRDYVDGQWRAALHGAGYDIEHRIRGEGRVKWVREKAFLELDSSGVPLSGFGIAQDITERKSIEFERLRLVSVVEKSPDFIGISDLSGTPIFLNRGGRRMVGLGDDFDVRNTEIRDYFVLEERNFVEREVLPTVLKEGRWSGDLSFRHWQTGAAVPVLFDVFRVDDPEGKTPLYFATVTRDMTEQRRAANALRMSEEQFRAVYENAAIGIAIMDTEGRVLQCNPAYRALLGYSEEEFKQLELLDIAHSDDRAASLAQIRLLQSQELSSFEMEGRCVRKDGEVVWVRKFLSQLRDEKGRPTQLVALVTDMTARRELERALLAADRRKDEFLAMLAHELRNPLAPIRNGVSVLRKTLAPATTTNQVLEIMERQVHHVVRLVDDLMDVSRITQGKIELRKERIDLVTVLKHVIATSQSSIDAVHHALHVSLPPEPVWVLADEVRIAQVLDNLLGNAIKYMDPGGSIWVTLGRRGDEAEVIMRDQGIGIQPELLPHVFDLFTQFDHESPKARGGMGLGLWLVRRLIELHGGQVAAVSDGLGKGSEFSIRLRLADPLGASALLVPLPPASTFPRRVLIVDDNRDAADSLALTLDLLGMEIHVDYDGPAALQTVDIFKPEVILLDLSMPGMDGFEAARKIRQHPNGRSPHLIALSGWGQEQDKTRSQEAGFDHHLVKPVDLDLLESTLASLSCRKEEPG